MINLSNIISYGRGTLPNLIELNTFLYLFCNHFLLFHVFKFLSCFLFCFVFNMLDLPAERKRSLPFTATFSEAKKGIATANLSYVPEGLRQKNTAAFTAVLR